MTNIRPQDPIGLGLCRQIELDEAIDKAERSMKRAQKKKEKEERERLAQANETNQENEESTPVSIEE